MDDGSEARHTRSDAIAADSGGPAAAQSTSNNSDTGLAFKKVLSCFLALIVCSRTFGAYLFVEFSAKRSIQHVHAHLYLYLYLYP